MGRWQMMTGGTTGRSSDDDLRTRLRIRTSEILRLEAELAAATARFNADIMAGERNGQAAITSAARAELAQRAVARVAG